jgi:ABC-type nickel/cobalt efflux system permease component RcnA
VSAFDHWIAGLAHGGGIAIALITALLLGVRHATDPDHLTAVSTLALSDEHRGCQRGARLGLAWGAGHATTLVLFGVPTLLLRRYLPAPMQDAAEALIGVVIIALAIRLLVRWRRGYFHSHPHRHGERWHTHPHVHEGAHSSAHAHEHPHAEGLGRSPLAAYGIGLVHGMGGSAGVTLVLIGAIPDRPQATAALIIFALATAVSMSALSAGFGTAIASRLLSSRLERAVPVLGACSLGFGIIYALVAFAGA